MSEPSGWYPTNPLLSKEVQKFGTSGPSATCLYPVKLTWSAAQAVAASNTAVRSSFASTTSAQSITSGFTNPPCPRNITITAGGTAADIAAVQATVHGTDVDGNVISENLPAFTVNTAGTVSGSKAFATVTKVDMPGHDGTGATFTVGYGDKLGIPYKCSRNPVLRSFLGNTLEGTAATVAVSSTVLSDNTIDLNSALNGSEVIAECLL